MRKISQILFLYVATASIHAVAQEGPTKYELSFQFDQNGSSSGHTYIMKWSSPAANLQSIDVKAADSNAHLQTITVPQEEVKLIYQEIATTVETNKQKSTTAADKILDSLDYNFDGIPDLRLLKQWPYRPGAKGYLIFLANEKNKLYNFHPELSKLTAPVPNPKTKRIESTTLMGWGGSEFVTRYYSINSANKLTVEAKVTQTITDPKKLIFQREIRLREKGELQRVCTAKIIVEGKMTEVKGRKKICQQYLKKN
jgi:hypothetical protein